MKVLKNELYAALSTAAQNYNAIVAAAKEADPTLAENASAEDILSAIAESGASQDMAAQNATLQASVSAQAKEIATLKATIEQQAAQIKTLSGTPAAPAPKIDSKEEPIATAEDDVIKSINDKHGDDPVALAAAMKKAGLV